MIWQSNESKKPITMANNNWPFQLSDVADIGTSQLIIAGFHFSTVQPNKLATLLEMCYWDFAKKF